MVTDRCPSEAAAACTKALYSRATAGNYDSSISTNIPRHFLRKMSQLCGLVLDTIVVYLCSGSPSRRSRIS
jgi:hypothetical protein